CDADRQHRQHPSFPTRRSSDLSPAITNSRRIVPMCAPVIRDTLESELPSSSIARMTSAFSTGSTCRPGIVRGVREDLPTLGALRSEEHTSELQSPYDLVCRRLL